MRNHLRLLLLPHLLSFLIRSGQVLTILLGHFRFETKEERRD